jgi:hypothetical protein
MRPVSKKANETICIKLILIIHCISKKETQKPIWKLFTGWIHVTALKNKNYKMLIKIILTF